MKRLAVLIVALALQQASAGPRSRRAVLCQGFLPPNKMQIPIGARSARLVGMTQAQFNADIGKVANVYNPIFANKGIPFVIEGLWNNNNVNSQAYIDSNGVHVVEIWGGLARHPLITDDALKLVVCHEIGHHLGGAPKFSAQGNTWASVEGQADYFATMKCLRKVFATDGGSVPANVAPTAQQQCQKYHNTTALELAVCERISMAGQAAAALSATLDGSAMPNFTTPDPSIVSQTFEQHPAGQCRLDTYFHGGLCQVSDSVDFDNSNPDVGACLNNSSEGYGARPLCWYKPSTTPPGPGPNPVPTPPPPANGVATTPTLNGSTNYRDSNPMQVVQFQVDVSNFSNAYGFYYEIAVNRDFSDPNGIMPDPNAIHGGAVPLTKATIHFVPQYQLPGWGTYKFRIIPLDQTGRQAVGRFSNSAVLVLKPSGQ